MVDAAAGSPNDLVGLDGTPPKNPRYDPITDLAVATLDLSTHKLTTVHRPSPELPLFGALNADARAIVWVQASDPGYSDWHLFVFDRGDSRTMEIAHAGRTADGGLIPTVLVMPKTDHGVVVWGAATAEAPLGNHSNVYVANLDGSGLRRIARDAANPQLSWPYVAYIQHTGPPLPGGEVHLAVLNLVSGVVQKVPQSTGATYWAIDGQGVAWVDGTRKRLT
ncbi:MAG: hypothetical protein ACREPA_11065, partial [Candidatus Dormibacteraceae bacterium]